MCQTSTGAKHGGSEQDRKDFFSRGAPICINKETYKQMRKYE